jgi:integrase
LASRGCKTQPAISTGYILHTRKIIKEAIGPYQVTKLTLTTLEDFLTDLSEKKYKSNYIDSVLKTLKQAVKKGIDDDQIPIGALRPFQKVKSPMAGKNSDARSRIITVSEFDTLYENALSHHKPLLATLYWTGMRPGEVLNLVWAQVNLPRRQIILEGGDTKTEDPRIIPIVPPLYEILKEHPRTLRTNYVFNWNGQKITNIHKSMVALAIKSKIPWGRKVRNGWTLHDFRHTWVTNARRAGVAESVIMKITGHKTREMFDRYNFVDEKDAMTAGELLTRLIDSDNTTDDRLA